MVVELLLLVTLLLSLLLLLVMVDKCVELLLAVLTAVVVTDVVVGVEVDVLVVEEIDVLYKFTLLSWGCSGSLVFIVEYEWIMVGESCDSSI